MKPNFGKYLMQLVVMLATTAFPFSASALNVSPTSLEFEAAGGTKFKAITVSTTSKVTATADADWLSMAVSKSGSTSAVTVQATANEGDARTATITITAGGETATVSVSQKSAAAEPSDYSGCKIKATAADIARLMYPGWNLGNTMEASGGETSWQKTKTSQEIINYVKSLGFKSVRIPCSWDIHSTNGTIDAAWMARVKEIVDYCVSAGLYVLLNDHWDNGWIEVLGFSQSSTSYKAVTESDITKKITQLKNLWTQIATTFKDYDEHLLFAGLNEPFQEYNLFNDKHKTLTPILERYNQAFVDAVRATGGNNLRRTLVVQAPGANISSACSYLTMPTDLDSQTGYMMLEAHYYDPWDFTGGSNGYFWGTANHVSGSSNNCSWGEGDYCKNTMAKLKTAFVSKGYPVILGEYGANWRKLSSNQSKHDASIKAWFKDVTLQSINNGVVPMVWDINSPSQNGTSGTMTIVNRANLSVFCTYALEGIQEGVKAATWGGPASGIATVPFDRSADVKTKKAYNVLGQRVGPGTKGLVIIGGRKYVNK